MAVHQATSQANPVEPLHHRGQGMEKPIPDRVILGGDVIQRAHELDTQGSGDGPIVRYLVSILQ